jgi:predicted Zn-dependent protease
MICGCGRAVTAPAGPVPRTATLVAPNPARRPVTRADLDAALAAVRAAPRSSTGYVRLADTYLALGQLADGANALRQAAALDPQSETPLIDLARLYKQAGRYEDRECNVLRRLIALRTTNALVYLRLGQIYVGLSWVDQARPLLDTALQLDPNSTAAQVEIGHCQFLSGKTDQAIAQLLAMHRKAPDSSIAANLLAQYYLATHDYQAAETALRETLRFQPKDRDLQVELAFVLMQQNRPTVLAEAVALLKGVAGSGQRQLEAYAWLGRISEGQNRTEEAIAYYQKAVELQPEFENVSLALGRLLVRQGKRQEGERLVNFYQVIKKNSAEFALARELLQQHPDDASAHAKVATWYTRLKEYPNAIMELNRVLELRPGDSSARRQLADALAATGRLSEAKALWSSAQSAGRPMRGAAN